GLAERQVVGVGADAQGTGLGPGRAQGGAGREGAEDPSRDTANAHGELQQEGSRQFRLNTNSVPPSGLAATIFSPSGPKKAGIDSVRPETTATYCLPS